MKKYLLFLFLGLTAFGQNSTLKELTFTEYLGYVKKYHPMVKSANLEISNAQASLMMARGGFDPKIEVDYSKKQFKDNEYYSILNSSFKIPTWYGIEVKAGFENDNGIYLNPENTLPNQGLASFGITVPVGQGLFINQRMADVRKAKINLKLGQNQQKLQSTGRGGQKVRLIEPRKPAVPFDSTLTHNLSRARARDDPNRGIK